MYYKEVVFESDDKKQVICERNKYNIVKNISWKDVKMKIYLDAKKSCLGREVSADPLPEVMPDAFPNDECRFLGFPNPYDHQVDAIGRGGGEATGSSLPGTIMGAYNEICGKTSPWRVIHLYYSFEDNAMCLPRHKDATDVFIVQAIGKMSYKFDNGRVCTLNPGDSMLIPVGVYHTPITSKPRITLSCSRTIYSEVPIDADDTHLKNST
jgi:hypothetical protein